MSRILAVVAVAVAAVAQPAAASPGADAAGLRVDPPEIGIGLGFHGASVTVSARVPDGATAVFRLVGPERDVRLKVKERVAGIVWASVSVVHFEGVPTVMLVRGWPALPPAAALQGAGLVPEAMESRVVPRDAPEGDRDAFREMLKLYRGNGWYDVAPGGERHADGTVAAAVDLPSGSPPGHYSADVTFFRGAAVIGHAEAPVEVREAGVVAFVSRLARENAVWYGVAAVVVAIFAGLLTGFVFGRGAKGGH